MREKNKTWKEDAKITFQTQFYSIYLSDTLHSGNMNYTRITHSLA